MQRLDVLQDLILFSKPIEDLTSGLSQLTWDYDGEPLIVKAAQVKEILLRYLDNEFSALELEQWANLIECREDLEFEKGYQEIIENIVYCLANPSLEGDISPSSCQALLKCLN